MKKQTTDNKIVKKITKKTTKNTAKAKKNTNVYPIKNKYGHKTTMSVLNRKGNSVQRTYNIYSKAHMREVNYIPISIRNDIIKSYNKEILELNKIKDRQNEEKNKRIEQDKLKKERKNKPKTDKKGKFLVKTVNSVLLETTYDVDKTYKDKTERPGRASAIMKKNFYYDKCPTKDEVLADIEDYMNAKKYITFLENISIDIIDTQKRIIPIGNDENAITKAKKKNKKLLKKIKLFGCKLNYNFSKDYDSHREDNNMCVIDYLRYELQGNKQISKKLLTQKSLMNAFNMKNLTEGISLEQIIRFVKLSNYISLYAFDPTGRLIKKIKGHQNSKVLVFTINNNHIYPIINKDYKLSVINKEIIQMSDYKFDINYDNCIYIDNINNLFESNDIKVKLIPECEDFIDIMHRVEEKTSMITTNMKWSNGRLTAFENDGTVYEKTLYHDDRKELLKSLYKKYTKNNELFEFKNQTYAQIGKSIFEYHFGDVKLLKSSLTEQQFNIFNTYNILPYFKVIGNNYMMTKNRYGVSWDINKSYTDVLLTNEYDYNIFTEFDDIRVYEKQDIENGEYYINRRFEMSKGSQIWMENGYYPHNFVSYCIDNKYITKNDITYYMKASYKLPANTLRKFVEIVQQDSLKKSDLKRIINFFIGTLGQKWNKKDSAINTNVLDIALYCMTEQELHGYDVELDWHQNENTDETLYQVRSRKTTMNLHTSLPIHRSIICGGIMNLDKLYNKIVVPNMIVVGYCTDAIKVLYKDGMPIHVENECSENIGGYKLEDYKITGKILDDEAKNPNYEHKIYKVNNYTRYDIQQLMKENKPFLLTGAPGTGKSYTLGHEIFKEGDIVLSFTNKAVVNCRAYNMKAQTLDISFYMCDDDIYKCIKRMKPYNNIYVDEYSMTSPKHMSILYGIWKLDNKMIRFIGDVNQCLSVSDKQYDYTKCNAFLEMIGGNIVTLDYVQGKCRQDNKLILCINYLLEHKKLHPMLRNKTYNDNANIHITKFNLRNGTVNNINNTIIQKLTKIRINGRKLIYIDKQPYFTGMDLVCNITKPNDHLYRSELYKITDFHSNKVCMKSETGNEIKIDYDNIGWFQASYAMTVYRYQGSSIDVPFNVMDVNHMSLREIYTAISRAKNYDDLHLDYTNKIFTNEEIDNLILDIKLCPIINKKQNKKENKKENNKKTKNNFDIMAPVKILNTDDKYSIIIDEIKKCIRVSHNGIRKDFRYAKRGIENTKNTVEEYFKSSNIQYSKLFFSN